MVDLVELWPAAGLRVQAGDLELRWIDDEALLALANLASRGVHNLDSMPFAFPWTRGTPVQVARSVLAYQWRARAQVSSEGFDLELAVCWRGQVVGVQSLHAPEWGLLRQGETGSWLGLDFQGRGIGTQMRALMLALAFDGLDAREVTSAAFADNAASNAISRRVGYLDNGLIWRAREGSPARLQLFRMPREQWDERREGILALLPAPVECDGLAAMRRVIDS